MSEGRKGVKNYFQQLKLAVNPIYNEVQNRNKKRVPVKVESGNSESGHRKDCICKQLYFGMYLKSCEERKKVIEVAGRLWGEDKKLEFANYLMAVMYIETAGTFSPAIENKRANVLGLLQFQVATAISLNTTQAKLKAMSFIEQMDYVERYLFKSKKVLTTGVDLYLFVMLPSAVGMGNNPQGIIFDSSIDVPDSHPKGDGYLTKKEEREKNITKNPWAKKYGYKSNPSFLMEDKKKEYNTYTWKWSYLHQKLEYKRGYDNGKTYVWEVDEKFREELSAGEQLKYKGFCKNDQTNHTGERAPWMEVAIKEAQLAEGRKEWDVSEQVIKYHRFVGATESVKTPWCTSFLSWCLEQVDVKSIKTAGSRFYRFSEEDRMVNDRNSSFYKNLVKL
ncbi:MULTISPECIES: hypothetical protein [unclassified Myroides]|uniref:hypothetical protein n=1 Tax=unclassified Myroides TaxID=2642485 RepID=UPI003D2F72D1